MTPQREFSYDTLVMAVGSLTNDFGTPGAKEYAISLETPVQAERFHRRLVNAYIRAHAQAGPLRPEQLQVAIIGAGATGVELAAELHNTTRTLVSYGLDRIDPEKDMRLILIEAADRILPALPPRLSDAASRLLAKLNVNVRTSARVAEVLPDGVRLATGEIIPAELVVWAAGRKGARFSQRPRRTGDQSHQSTRRAADTANDARREYFRHRRLRRMSVARQGRRAGAASCAVRPSAGVAHGQADRAPTAQQASVAVAVSRLRFARFTRRVLRRRQS